jgi:acetyl-CoA synthetase
MGDLDSLETIFVVKHTGEDAEMKDGRDVWYHDALEAADDECEAEALDAEHPLFILYSSGSTAKPKGILHTTGRLPDARRLDPQERLRPQARRGRVVVLGRRRLGHRPLLHRLRPADERRHVGDVRGRAGLPDKDIWWELCERYGVTLFYTAPTAIRACIKWGAKYPERHDLSKLRLLGTVGEPINPKAWLWYWKVIGGERCPVVDTWWQTETSGIMITTLPGAQYAKPGSAGTPLPGIDAAVVDEDGNELTDEQGLLILRRPWPGMLRTLYKDDDRFIETYFSRFGKETYLVGDAARKDSDGYFWIVGRVDDVINVSGHRLSTAEVESAIVAHGKVAEAAVVAMADEDTGQAIVAYVTLEGDLEGSDELVAELREHVAKRIGKLARPRRIIWSGDLPKTRSGKIMRRLLRDIAEGRELGDVTTLRDPAIMDELKQKVAERGDSED